MRLQNILLKTQIPEITRHMYYRSSIDAVVDKDGNICLKKKNWFDFFTYFNSLSVEKWFRYTYANKFYLVIDAHGAFDISLFGHYKSGNEYLKEELGKYTFDIQERTKLRIPYPSGMRSSIAAFLLETKSKTTIYDMFYETDIEDSQKREIFIAMVTTTFGKEDYVRRNINLLENDFFSESEYAEHFCWNIIDNGRTLQAQFDEDKKIRIIPNNNVGGAGGFSRGMIESLKQKKSPTHILLMDDDVVFSVESFKKLYALLGIVKDEYKDNFVSGAMLKMGQPNIQHEDLGKLNPLGFHEALKPNLDLNLWDAILENEIIPIDKESNTYAAWWFCCIPTSIANMNNLPIPVFVRGDDVEYSIRNRAKFISMNGICIWHEGFENKFSAALEFYQVNRNELIVQALNPHINTVDFMGHIKQIFWEEIYKFNYKGAALLLDAIEDFLKGPKFIMELDGEQCMKDKKALDNHLQDFTIDVQKRINPEKLFQFDIIKGIKLFIYNHTCNGQKRIPTFLAGKGVGVIPYGWGYDKGKMAGKNVIYAVDLQNHKYAKYVRSRKMFKLLEKRYQSLLKHYENDKERIESLYQDNKQKMTSDTFWSDYLGI